jgi:hypothetical protein
VVYLKNNKMLVTDRPSPPNYLRIALQSALAAVLCLGLPAGLSLWLILLQQTKHSSVVQHFLDFLQIHGLYSIYIVILSSILWSYLLGRISRYRPWWLLAVASAVGILAAWFSPLSNVDGILYSYRPDLPVYLNYAASMIGLIGSVTLFVGLGYGLVLCDLKAALIIGMTTSIVAVVALLITIIIFDRLGLRVGTGNLAMVRVTVLDLITSALAGGAMLGVEFSRFVHEQKRRLPASS